VRCATYLKGRVGIYILQVYKRKNGVVDGTGGGTAAKGTEATGIIVKPYTHTFTNSHTHTHMCCAGRHIRVYCMYIYIYKYMYGAFDRGWHVYARTYSGRSLCRRVRPYNGKPFGGDFYIIYTYKYIYMSHVKPIIVGRMRAAPAVARI